MPYWDLTALHPAYGPGQSGWRGPGTLVEVVCSGK